MKRPFSLYTLNLTFEDNLGGWLTHTECKFMFCFYKMYATILFGKMLEDRQQALTSEDLVVPV